MTKMLGTALILLACVSGIVSDGIAYQSPTNAGYQQPYGRRNDNLQAVRQLENSVNEAFRNDDAIVDRLEAALDGDEANTRVFDFYLNNRFPSLRQRQANQSDDIGDLFLEANRLLLLVDDVAVLNSTTEELQRQANILDQESIFLQQQVKRLTNVDAQQRTTIAAVRTRLAGQQRTLDALENATRETREILDEYTTLAANITQIQDREQADSYEFILTNENPSQQRSVDRDFREATPFVIYGFTSLRVSDESRSYVLPPSYVTKGYNGYESTYLNDTIRFRVEVEYNPEVADLTATLFDNSVNGWVVRQITVSATLINISNRNLRVAPLPPAYVPPRSYAPSPSYASAPTYAPSNSYAPGPSNAPTPSYAPSPSNAPAPTYAPSPSYAPIPSYSTTPTY